MIRHQVWPSSLARRAQLSVQLPVDTRVVGLSSGLGVVYRDGKQLVASALSSDGEVVRPSRFGKSVQKLCAQTASNDHRFGVAWTEADGAVWFVHGPTSPTGAQQVELPTDASRASGNDGEDGEDGEAAPRQPSYCGIASAGEKIALLWRDRERTYLLRCGRKCDGLATRPALDVRRTLLGFGCTRDACVVVTRDPNRLIEASWVKSNGKLAWTRPLPSASGDTEVSIVGMRDTLAIAYETGAEPIVTEVTQDGTLTPIWQASADPDTVPGVVWSDGTLLVVHQRDGELATAIVRR